MAEQGVLDAVKCCRTATQTATVPSGARAGAPLSIAASVPAMSCASDSVAKSDCSSMPPISDVLANAAIIRAVVRHCNALLLRASLHRQRALLMWRRAHCANRDAVLVFKAASEGRPLELAKRLTLGRLAGALYRRYPRQSHHLEKKAVVDQCGGEPESVAKMLTPMEAAEFHDHSECVAVLKHATLT